MSGSRPTPSAIASGQSPYLVPMNGTADKPKPLNVRHTPTIGQSDFCQIGSLTPRPILTLLRPGAIQAHPGSKSTRTGAWPDLTAASQNVMSWLLEKPMDKFTTLEGVAAPLDQINVDTDMIIPKQYLKTIKRTGLGKGLFSEKRYRDDGSENPDFVLNKPAYRKAKILVAGDNFGCGSSREHAPWALLDFGIRCVISTSFGDIFYNNCFKNGILPIKVSREDLDKLFDDADRGANATLTIDLAKQEIRGPDGGVVTFEIDQHRKHCLLNGLDDIGLTLEKNSKIDSFESQAHAQRPWA
jgi:3-isopropylmalate/(R)-2-methylmalate dehydratase small subunit